MIALADRYITGQYDHKTGSEFTNRPERFTSCKPAHVAKTAHTLDFREIERGIDLIVPLFSNGLRWRHHDLHEHADVGEQRHYVTPSRVPCELTAAREPTIRRKLRPDL